MSGPRPAFSGVFLVRRCSEASTFLSFYAADSKAAALWWRKEQSMIPRKKAEELSHTNKHADAALIELNKEQKVFGN